MVAESTLKTKDGLNLYSKSWTVENPRAVIALVHGFGEHCNRYDHVADFFNKNNFSVVAYDRRGHGKSDGKRGHMTSHESIIDEVDLLLEKCRSEHPGKEIILYGHSQGGNVVLHYLLKHKVNLSKDLPIAMVTGPWIKLGFEPPKIKVFAGKLLENLAPSVSQSNELDVNLLSHDPKVVKDYVNDPLVHSEVTFKCGMEMLRSGAVLENYKGDFPIPLLILHGGEDQIISPEGSRIFEKNVTGDITLNILEGQYHEIHNEVEYSKVFDMFLGWINEKLR